MAKAALKLALTAKYPGAVPELDFGGHNPELDFGGPLVSFHVKSFLTLLSTIGNIAVLRVIAC